MKKLPSNLNLDNTLPVDLRICVYKKAIEVIETEVFEKYGLFSGGLCLLLPCLLWDLDNPMKSGPNFYRWDCSYTAVGFPELTNEVKEEIYISEIPNQKRLEYLKKFIKDLENELTTTV